MWALRFLAVGVRVGARDSSALAYVVAEPSPPAASTIPFGSKVAVCPPRALFRLPVNVQVPLVVSYSSARAEKFALPHPPATRTMPLGSKVAVCSPRPC